jgi:hypothetical protein
MLRSNRILRALIATGTGALIAGGLAAAAPASGTASVGASRTAPTSARGSTSAVTILLKAPNQAGLDRLAGVQGLGHAQRIAALSALLPSAAAHRTVANELRGNGFTVTHQTAWTIDARAATTTVASLFGSRPSLPHNASDIQRARAAGALPRIPASIASLTAAVLPTSGGPKLFTPLAKCSGCRNGTNFRNAYTAPHVAPTTGNDVNGALTIATLQFAGWNKSDLTSYAKSVGLPTDPVTSGQFTQIPVDGATVPTASTKEDEADEEVDLDQETILSTDPTADERAYFDTKATKAGYADALSQVLADVTQGTGDVDGGDPKIAALSTSWGTCESEFSDHFAFPHDTITAIENIMKSLTAAGVTVFAASGDDGVYDCGDGSTSIKTAVDYPASSPEVVGVGGTRLKFVGKASANTGTNWSDTAWSCTSASICQGFKPADTGGSGGGESKMFTQPAYQVAGIGQQQFTTSTGKKGDFGSQPHRLVPDIADDGDPDTGFGVVTTDPTDDKSCAPPLNVRTCKPKTFAIGGTSLSSPEAASLFTDMLGSHGATAGVGDIHDALYSAYADHNGSFRDVRTGSNGHQKDVDARAAKHTGYELPVTAQKGYDTVTGLGAPLWPKIAPFIFTPAVPSATGRITLASPHSATRSTRVRATWRARQTAKDGSAAASASVTITRQGSSKPIYHSKSAPAFGSRTFTGVAGGIYTLTVTERDLARQKSAPTTEALTVPYDDSAFTFHGAWKDVRGGSDYGGSLSTTESPGAFAKVSVSGRSYTLDVRTGPAYGKLAIYHGATRIGIYDLFTPSVRHRLIPFFGTAATAPKKRTFTFRFTGHKDPSATHSTIDVDALIR